MLLYTNADEDLGYNIDDEVNHKHIIDFFISTCNGLVFDFGPTRIESDEGLLTEDWMKVRVEGVGTTIPDETSTVLKLYHNDVEVNAETSNYVIWPDLEPNFHIGSYKGVVYHFNGFVYDFCYELGQTFFFDDTPVDLSTISTCQWW